MIEKRHFTDEELVSFLDGECDGDLVTEISLALETDSKLQSRMADLDLDKELLRESFDQLLEIAPKASLGPGQGEEIKHPLQDNQKTSFTMRPYMQIAALLLAGFIGFSANFLLPSSEPEQKKPGWIDMVVNYQKLYGKNTLAHIKTSDETAQLEIKRVSAAIGRKLDFEIITSRKDIELKQARVLNFNGKPLAQIAYQSPLQGALALCVIKSKKPGDKSPSYSSRENMQLAVWRKGGFAFLLIGGQDPNLIKNISEDLSKKL